MTGSHQSDQQLRCQRGRLYVHAQVEPWNRREFDTFKHDMDGLEGQMRGKDDMIAGLNHKLLEAGQVKKPRNLPFC
jgi:hypothetical protein